MTCERLFIGLMSGTSADGVDAALVAFDGDRCRLLATHNHPLPPDLRSDIHALTLPGDNEIQRMARLDNQLGELFAGAVQQLLRQSNTEAGAVTAIGSHGQTIRHEPGRPGFTLQVGNAHLIAERTGILTVADFRRRDMACGGEGAPLAPAFHYHQFGSGDSGRCIANVGGIANITVLRQNGSCTGFDTGPGNTLLDAWTHRWQKQPYDRDGAWAASAAWEPALLARMQQHPFLARTPPKSTGREDFNLEWLQALLDQTASLTPAQVQATLLEFTAATLADAIDRHCPMGSPVYLCGGGAHNRQLMARLQARLPAHGVDTTEALGIHPDWVEAAAFAWLAKRYLDGEPGNLPAVTGAERPVVLGAAHTGSLWAG